MNLTGDTMLRVSSMALPLALLTSVVGAQPNQQDVTFESEGESLVGTLFFPEGEDEPLGVIVLGHGSDPTTRESNQFYLTKALELGFAAFSYDKRGCGESGGEFVSFSVATSEENFELLGNDMANAFKAVESIEGINNDLIGIMGGSQAGWIMPLAASKLEGRVDFIVSFCGVAVSSGEEGAHGEFMNEGGSQELTLEKFRELSRKADAGLKGFDGDRAFDPRDILKTLETPHLWVLGGLDPVVPTNLTLGVLAGINANQQGNNDIVVWAYSDHNARNVVTGERYGLPATATAWLAHKGLIDADPPGNWGAIPASFDITDPEKLAVLEVAEKFVTGLETKDRELLDSIFVSGEVPFVSPIIGRDTTYMTTADKFFDRVLSDDRAFTEQMREIEIRIDDGHLAYMSFDYVALDGGAMSNWGREYWAMVKTNKGWKITSVTWTMTMVPDYR